MNIKVCFIICLVNMYLLFELISMLFHNSNHNALVAGEGGGA